MKLSKIFLLSLIVFSIYLNVPRETNYDFYLAKTHYKGKIVFPPLNLNGIGLNFVRDLSLQEGLDLKGGSHLVFEADMNAVNKADRPAALEAVKTNIERRINFLGVSEPIIQTAQTGSSNRLIVELAGVSDVKQAISLIGTTAQLDFRELVGSPSAEASIAAILSDFKPTSLTGRDLQKADVQYDSKTGAPVVGLEFSPDGAKKFADITKRNLGKPLAIFLDGLPITSPPRVNNVIEDGRAIITGSFSIDEVKQLVAQLNSGALPVPVKLIEERTVGATLGSDSVHKSLTAGIIGLAVIALFMVANYGFKGIIADLALILYIIFSLAIFRLLPVTMTLAGIAGFILSIGMAVDANILIFERMKEEVRWGRSVTAALDLGFSRAWTSIKDSNMSSLITCSILFWLGSGSVRGFALTLAVGIFVSLFTSINVTKTLLEIFYRR